MLFSFIHMFNMFKRIFVQQSPYLLAVATRMSQRVVQGTTVRKTLRTPPRAWACRRTREMQQWGKDEDGYSAPPVHRQRVRQTVARMSRARETEHLSFRPVPTWPFLFPFATSSSLREPLAIRRHLSNRTASSSFGDRARHEDCTRRGRMALH